MKNDPYSINLSKVCRLCFVEKTDLLPIFDNTNIPDLSLKIEQCVSVEISNDDQLPDQICEDCFKEIRNWIDFREKCTEADVNLKQYVQNAQVKEESGEDIESMSTENHSSPEMQTTYVFDVKSEYDQTTSNDVINPVDFRQFSIRTEPDMMDGFVNEIEISTFDPFDQSSLDTCEVNDETDDNTSNLYSYENISRIVNCDPSCNGDQNYSNDAICLISNEIEPVNEKKMDDENSPISENLPNPDNTDDINTSRNQNDDFYVNDGINTAEDIEEVSIEIDLDTINSLEIQQPRKGPNSKRQQLICNHCHKRFRLKNTLKRHIQLEHLPKPTFNCNKCERSFTTKHTLVLHEKSHSPEKSCDQCNFKCNGKGILADHMTTHTGEKAHSCENCDKKFHFKNSLTRHKSVHEDASTRQKKKRPINGEEFDRLYKIKIDSQSHQGDHKISKRYACDQCDFKTIGRSSIADHITIHSGEKNYACDICDRRFHFKSSMKSHRSVHDKSTHRATGEPISCECGKTYKNKYNLRIHRMHHHQIKRFVCDVCEKRFAFKDALIKHRNVHNRRTINPMEKRFACDLCDYKCIKRFSLTTHMTVHTGEKPYICEICDKRFNFKPSYNRHKKIHDESYHFVCDYCQKQFWYKNSLRAHILAHIADKTTHSVDPSSRKRDQPLKRYTCEICDYKCAKLSLLKNHFRKHTGEKPYVCDTCGNTFTHKSTLIVHKRIHQDTGEFVCDHCQKRFRLKATLRQHIQEHVLKFKCNQCDKRFVKASKLHIHRRSHQSADFLKCDQCYFATELISEMNDHKVTKHKLSIEQRSSNTKTFRTVRSKAVKQTLQLTCELCDYKFDQMSQLLDHFRTHTGEKPFFCEMCDGRFTRSLDLLTHKRICHEVISSTLMSAEIVL